jgi:hypothetical protein
MSQNRGKGEDLLTRTALRRGAHATAGRSYRGPPEIIDRLLTSKDGFTCAGPEPNQFRDVSESAPPVTALPAPGRPRRAFSSEVRRHL